ncbi:ankyrin repeat-containing domain protein [Ilyonectria sp. MPI-CAGE-AT-0026]|nr:ankyrin repeat-containing domain protein [Ilyonectria sp. MPI-CAGE-AT-0026]
MPINWSLYEQDAVKKYMDDRMSAKDACKWINDKYGTNISLRQFKSKFMGLKNLTSLEWKAVSNEIEIHKQIPDQVFDVYISGRRQDPERVKRALQRCDKHAQAALDADIGFGTVGEHRVEIRSSISQSVVAEPVLENTGVIPAVEESIESLANLDVEPLNLTTNAEDMADLAIRIQDTNAHDLSTLQQGDHFSPGFSAFLSSFLSSPLNHSNMALVSPSPVDAPIMSEMIHEPASHSQQVILSPRQQPLPDAIFTSSATSASILGDSMQALVQDSQATWSQTEVALLFPNICQNSAFNPKNGFRAGEWDQVPIRVPRGEPGWLESQLKYMDPKIVFPHHVASVAEFVFTNNVKKGEVPFESQGFKSHDQLFSLVGYLLSNEALHPIQFANCIKWIFDNDQFSVLTEFLLRNSTNMSTFITKLLHLFANSRDIIFSSPLLLSMIPQPNMAKFNKFCDHIFRRYPTETFNLIQAAEKRAIDGSLGRDLIMHFVQGDNLEAAAKLLHSRSINVNFVASGRFRRGQTPLEAAVFEGSVEMVTFLIDHARADVNHRFGDNEKKTALCTATERLYVKMVEVLLERGATVYHDLMIGDEDLLTHARKHSVSIFKLLTGPSRNNALDIFELVEAAEHGNRTLCQFIEDHQIVRDEILERGLYYAIETANVRAVRRFLHRKVDPDTPNYRRARNAGEFDENPDSRHPIVLGGENLNDAAGLAYLLLQAGSKPTHDDLIQLCHYFVLLVDEYYRGEADKGNVLFALVQAGCDVAAIGPSALEISAGHGSLLECGLLLGAGIINIDEYGVGGRSGLQCAAIAGKTAVVEYLIDRGADINLPASPVDRWPDQEDHGAMLKEGDDGTDDTEMADALRAARLGEQRLTALQAAALGGHIEVVDALIEAGANCQAPANTSGLITLLEAAAGPGAWTENYVRSGGKDRRMSIFNKLLARSESGAINRTDGTDSTVLHRLIRTAPIQCLDLALRAGARTEDRNPVDRMTPLQYAATHGKFDAMELLIKYNANINAPAADDRKHGRTALQAVLEDPFPSRGRQWGYADKIESMAALLLQHHARINDPAGKYYGRTALQQATSWNEPNAKIIAFLLIHGAEVNAPPAEVGGITALQGAAIRGDLQVTRMLIARGDNVNATPALRDGRTALEGAAEHGRLDMVQFLLKNGAVPDLTKGFGTAIKLAEKRERFEIADLLRREQEQAYTNLFNNLSDQLAWNPEPHMPELGTVMDNDDQDEMVI